MTNRLHRLAAVVVSLGAATAARAIAFEHFDLHIALTDSAAPPGIYQMRSHVDCRAANWLPRAYRRTSRASRPRAVICPSHRSLIVPNLPPR
jgi:hypothetical protein